MDGAFDAVGDISVRSGAFDAVGDWNPVPGRLGCPPPGRRAPGRVECPRPPCAGLGQVVEPPLVGGVLPVWGWSWSAAASGADGGVKRWVHHSRERVLCLGLDVLRGCIVVRWCG